MSRSTLNDTVLARNLADPKPRSATFTRPVALVAGTLVLGSLLAGCASSGSTTTRPAASSGAMTSDAPASASAVAPSESASGAVDLALLDETPIAASHATLYVQGLSCPACATNVNHQLKQVAGISTVGVNLGDGTVRVDFDGFAGKVHPSRAQLARAIHDSGFTLTRIEAGQ